MFHSASVSCCIPQLFLIVFFQDGGLFTFSECSEKQSARSSAISCGGQCLGNKRNHVTGEGGICCLPSGQTPTEAQLQPLLQPISLNPGNTACLKRLIFESQTLVCNEVKLKANRKDDAAHTTFAGPRDARVQLQKDRLTGLRFRQKKSVAICHMTSLSRCWRKTASFILDQRSFQQGAMNSCRRNPAKSIK